MAVPNVQQNVAIHFIARDQFSGPVAIMAGALATFSGAAIKMAADFDLAFARVTSLLPQTKQQLEGFKGEILDLSRALGVDAVGAMNGLYEAVSAGITDTTKAISFMEVASKSSIAGVTNIKTAVDGLTSAVNAFKIPIEQTSDVADQFFQAVNIGKETFEELSAAMYIAAPIASNTAVSLNELLAAQTSLTKSGATASVAMTQVRSALTALNKPSQNLQDILQKLGFESGKAAIQALGLQGTFEAIRKTADDMNMPLSRVFGRVEAVNAVLGLTGQNAEVARQDLDQLTNSTGAMQRAFDKIDDTPARRFQRAITDLKVSFIELGQTALPVMEAFTKIIDSIASALGLIPEPLKKGLTEFVSMVAIIGVAIALFTKLQATLAVLEKHFIATAAAANQTASATARAAATSQGYQVFNRRGAAPGTPGGGVVLTGAGAAGLYGLYAVSAITAIDSALAAFGQKGIFERLFGNKGDEELKRLHDIQDRLQQIREITNDLGQQELLRTEDLEDAIVLAGQLEQKFKEVYDKLGGNKKTRGAESIALISAGDEFNDFKDKVKDISTYLLEAYGVGSKLVDKVNELKGAMSPEVFQAFIEGTEAGKKYTEAVILLQKAYEKTIPLHKDTSESLLDVEESSALAQSGTLKLISSLTEEKDIIEALDDSLESLRSRFDDMNPAVQANNVLIEEAKLALAEIENGARNADGTLRDLTDSEKNQVKDINAYIDSLERANATTTQYASVLEALEKSVLASGKAANVSEEKLKTFASLIEESTAQGPEAVQRLKLLQQAFDTTNPEKAIGALVSLSQALGAQSTQWKTIASQLPPEFWKKLIGGIGDPARASQLINVLNFIMGSTFGSLNLSAYGARAANSFWGGLLSGISSVTHGVLDFSSIATEVENAGVQAAGNFWDGFGDGLSSGGGGSAAAEEAAKTAAEGFGSAFEDTLREFILKRDYGDLGGALIDAVVQGVEDNTEQAGSAIADAIDAIMQRLAETDPTEAEEFGRKIAELVATALRERTPEAIQAVEDFINEIRGRLAEVDDLIDAAISALDRLGNAVVGALKNKYTQERDDAISALEDKKDAARKAAEEQLKQIGLQRRAESSANSASRSETKQVSDAKVKAAQAAIDAAKEEYRVKKEAIEKEIEMAVSGYEKQVDALRKALEAMDRAEENFDHEKTIAELEKEKRRAKTSFGRWSAQQKIDEENRKYSLLLERRGIEDRIKGLQDLIDATKELGKQRLDALQDQYDKEIDILEDKLDKERDLYNKAKEKQNDYYQSSGAAASNYFNDLEQGIKDTLDATLDAIDDEIQAQKDKYDLLLDDENLYNEALILLMSGRLDDIVNLLNAWNPDWQNAGQSLGDALVYGLRSTKQDVANAVNEILAMVNIARRAAGEAEIPAISVTPDSPTTAKAPFQGGGSGGGGGNLTNPVGGFERGFIKPGFNLVTVPKVSNVAAFGPGAKIYTYQNGQYTQITDPNHIFYPGDVVFVDSPNGYASGSRFTAGGLALVGERGPELVQMPAGSQVTNSTNTTSILKKMEQILTGGGYGGDNPIVVHVYIGQEKVDEVVVKAMSRKSRLAW